LERNVLLVGCGNLGRWHIKGLETSAQDLKVFVADKNPQAMEELSGFLERYMRRPSNVAVVKTDLTVDELNNLPKIDLVIVATTANERELLLSNLVRHVSADFWLIEKPIAQSTDKMRTLLQSMKNEQCYVNHSRRLMPLHRKLKAEMEERNRFEVTCGGPNLGLACNASHFIDLLSWWSGAEPVRVETKGLSSSWHQASRPEFWDIAGHLEVGFDDGSLLKLVSSPDLEGLMIQVRQNDNLYCVVNEQENSISFSCGRKVNGAMLNQSELTGSVIDSLTKTGICDLPTLLETTQRNALLMDALLKHWNDHSEVVQDSLPIT